MLESLAHDDLNLERYGEVLARYDGEGTLTRGQQLSARCRFAAGQLRDGGVVVLCDFIEIPQGLAFALSETPDQLKGSTADGWSVSATGSLMSRNWLPDVPAGRPGVRAAFHAQELSVNRNTTPAGDGVCFQITNLGYRSPFSFDLPVNDELTLGIAYRPVSDHRERIRRLQAVRGTDVTAEVLVSCPAGMGVEAATEAVDDFCHVVSIAVGCQVQWICRRHFDSESGRELVDHRGRFTKVSGGLEVIDKRPRHGDELPRFVGIALPNYRRRKANWRLNRGPIAAYLDAKSEGDYLEQRGVKLAVAVEMLKSVFLASGEEAAGEWIIETAGYDRFVPELVDACITVLRTNGVTKESLDALVSKEKLSMLNRRSFRYLLKKLAAHVNLRLSNEELTRFIQNRNALVHQGQFYSENPVADWLFMVNVLDRIFLKLLGYTGPYINWTGPNGERRDTLD